MTVSTSIIPYGFELFKHKSKLFLFKSDKAHINTAAFSAALPHAFGIFNKELHLPTLCDPLRQNTEKEVSSHILSLLLVFSAKLVIFTIYVQKRLSILSQYSLLIFISKLW